MTVTWEMVARLPRWSSELAFAVFDAGIEVLAGDEFTDDPTTVVMAVSDETSDGARRRIRATLETCDVYVGIADFRGPFPPEATAQT
jgi:hypothetical protein